MMIAKAEMSILAGFKVAFEKCTGVDCCRNTAIAQITNRRPDGHMVGDDDYSIEFRCLGCGNHRGQMSDEMIKALFPTLKAFPEMIHDVHVVRGIHLVSDPAQDKANVKKRRGRKGRKGQ
jgi:hypothetical protein